jgi:hypothetical protein
VGRETWRERACTLIATKEKAEAYPVCLFIFRSSTQMEVLFARGRSENEGNCYLSHQHSEFLFGSLGKADHLLD